MRARTGAAQLPLHGGRAPAWLFGRLVSKDGTPFPVDTGTYDTAVEILRAAVNRAGIDRPERWPPSSAS